ncbi:MAG: HAMP domain-containing histidine kinase [bacterium]|nr:HAMP domain-containing histidine kinase [bacterium]
MLIKKKIQYNFIAIIIFAVIFAVFQTYQSKSFRNSLSKYDAISGITEEMGGLFLLSDEYITHPTKRVTIQWDSRINKISKLLLSSEFNSIEEKEIINNMTIKKEKIKKVFLKLIKLTKDNKAGKQDHYTVLMEKHMVVRLSLLSQSMIDDANRLARITKKNIVRTKIQNQTLIISIFAVLIILLVINLIFIDKGVLLSVDKIFKGAETVSSGNLDHRLNIEDKDEIGTMARAFNKITDHLQGTILVRTILEQKVSELESFAYTVSHDLKAPLRAISTYTEFIIEDYEDQFGEDVKNALLVIKERAVKMSQLIDGILQYSRAEKGLKNCIEINMNVLIDSVIDMLFIPENIKVSVQPDLPVIYSSEAQMQQIFVNLLSNAVKYIDKPEGKVEVTCSDSNNFWKFVVADNGPGIDPVYHEKVFEIFGTTLSRAEQKKKDSVGIGLSTVKKIIDLFGGKIWIESEAGKGARFCFIIPKT